MIIRVADFMSFNIITNLVSFISYFFFGGGSLILYSSFVIFIV